jgi:NAD(P)-dependent dehydrogenase (short-subunit alcohol dehydrogenase family)
MSSAERSILITGCSSGIGYAAAHGLKARGWRVFATARNPDDCERLKSEGLQAFRLDLTDPGTIETALGHVLRRTDGTLDAVYNNGGYAQAGALEDMTTDLIREQFEANSSAGTSSRAASSRSCAGRGRRIVSAPRSSALRRQPAAPTSLLEIRRPKAWPIRRLELHGNGIHVVLIEPGPIDNRFRARAGRSFAPSTSTVLPSRWLQAASKPPRRCQLFALPQAAGGGGRRPDQRRWRPARRRATGTAPTRNEAGTRRLPPTGRGPIARGDRDSGIGIRGSGVPETRAPKPEHRSRGQLIVGEALSQLRLEDLAGGGVRDLLHRDDVVG